MLKLFLPLKDKTNSSFSNPNIDLVSSTPILANNSIITPINTTTNHIMPTPQLITNTNNQHILLINEHYQLVLKKIWNTFEYAISYDSSLELTDSNEIINLMLDRHLDQLIMCSVYAACKISQMSIKFQDIMKYYRMSKSTNSSLVYRSVLLSDSDHRGDLISFYNQVYVKKVKNYIIQMSKSTKLTQTPSTNSVFICPSPVPKLPSLNLMNTAHFSPCKISNSNYSVFVSPSKTNTYTSLNSSINSTANTMSLGTNGGNNSSSISMPNTTSATQLTMPPMQLRNKLTFSTNDKNPTRSIEAINEMIRRNELKIKTSNKRLFSDISLQNSIPTTNHQAKTIAATSNASLINSSSLLRNFKTISSSSNELTSDETDGKSNNKIPRITTLNRSLTSTSFLNKIVSTKLGSTPNSNLVTMVIANNQNQYHSSDALNAKSLTNANASGNGTSGGGSSVLTSLGSNFARKLQDIQSERTLFK